MVDGADEVDGLLANAKVLPTNENSSASDASDFSESESSTEKDSRLVTNILVCQFFVCCFLRLWARFEALRLRYYHRLPSLPHQTSAMRRKVRDRCNVFCR